jgi:hypothetical protein
VRRAESKRVTGEKEARAAIEIRTFEAAGCNANRRERAREREKRKLDRARFSERERMRESSERSFESLYLPQLMNCALNPVYYIFLSQHRGPSQVTGTTISEN